MATPRATQQSQLLWSSLWSDTCWDIDEDAITSHDDHDISAKEASSDILNLLQKRLPPYVVNCFMVSGFDSIDVITSMDVSEKPGN